MIPYCVRRKLSSVSSAWPLAVVSPFESIVAEAGGAGWPAPRHGAAALPWFATGAVKTV